MNVEELQKVHDALSLLNSMVNCGDQHSSSSVNMTQAAFAILRKPLLPAEGATDKFRDVLNEVQRYIETNGGATESEMKAIWNSLSCAITESERRSQPPAEGAEEILASLIESLGEPDNSIHDHSYEIRPLTVNGKCEWWMFHNGVGSGEPLAQWLQNFATLHAQRIADKMVKDMRQKLFSMRSSKEPMYRLSEADRLMMYGYHDCINEMLMWTKPREI